MGREEIEKLLGLGKFQMERNVPGTKPINEVREFCYFSDDGQEDFEKIWDKVIKYISPPILKNGGTILEGCKLTLPNGEIYQAISYNGDIEGWRQQIAKGAEALNVRLAKIIDDSIVLNNNKSFRLTDCKVEFF